VFTLIRKVFTRGVYVLIFKGRVNAG